MTATKPTVAVVILNYNGRHFLEQFLPSVLESSYENLTIYVADNCSTDDSVPWLQANHPTIKIINTGGNLGFAGGYNTALDQVKAEYYVLLNSDVKVTPNWITPIIDLMEADSTIAAAQPKIRSHREPKLFEHAGGAGGWIDYLGYPFCRGRIFMLLEEDQGQYDDMTEIFWATGAALFIRSHCYHNLGGLDSDYFAHMEEIDLCWRLKRAGHKVVACPASTVYHVGGGTLPPSSPHKTYLNFRNSLFTMLKNVRGKQLFWLIPFRLILDGIAAARFLSEGKWGDIGAVLKAHFAFYRAFPKTLRKRNKMNRLIEKHRIGPVNRKGILNTSIIWAFFVKGKKYFSQQ